MTGISKGGLIIKKVIFLMLIIVMENACINNKKEISELIIISSKKTLLVGEKLQLNYTNTAKNLWTSSDLNVLLVDQNGQVIGVKNGYATISVVSSDGNTSSIDLVVEEKVSLDEISKKNLKVILGFGQSIASNTGVGRYVCKNNVFSLDYDGQLYRGQDPMKWADGVNGSVWSRLGDKLIDNGLCDNVIFITIGVGGTPISRWTKGGDLNNTKLIPALKKVKDLGLNIDYILWHQGSSDVGNSKEYYIEKFNGMVQTIRESGINSPIYVSLHSGDGDIGNNSQSIKNQRAQIREGQKLVVNNTNIFQGPDTDLKIPLEYRQNDKLHFLAIGNDKFADLWIEILNK